MKIKTDWNLCEIYENEEETIKDYEKYKSLCESLTTFKGKLNTPENILKYYKIDEEASKLSTTFFCYLYLRKSLNGKDEFSRKLLGEYEIFATNLAPKLAFVLVEMSKNSEEFLLDLAKRKEFSHYDQMLKDIARGKKHILPEKVQAALDMNPSLGNFDEVFDNFNDVDLKFGKIKVDGKSVELTHAKYASILQNSDQNTRKRAYNMMHKAFADFNYTLGSLYLLDAKESLYLSKLHKFKTLLEASCDGDKTDPKVLSTLIDVVSSNLDLFYRFERLNKKAHGIKDYYYFDNYLPIGSISEKFDFEKSCKIVLDALNVMGEEYVGVLKTAMESGWIDAFEKPSKTSGGFCLDIYGCHPYVLLNHENVYSGMSTIAHELGHAMHGYYTSKTQPITKADPSIFACEVASIVNEIILNKYMIAKTKSKEEKLYYVHNLLHHFYTTLYRQTMFSEFEYFVYSSLEKGKPLIVEDLNKEYERLQKKYFGDEAKKTKYSKYEWSRIPHFYRPYYVYKYSTGFISACTIAEKIMSGDKKYLEKYKNFLKAGSSVDPIELLKSVDVDLTSKSTFEGAFTLYKSLLDEFEELIN